MSDRPLASLGAHQAKPSADFLFHGGLLLSIETTQPTDQLDHGYGHKALSIESAWSEEPNAEGHLEAGAARLVVWGTSVTRARSASSTGTLSTNAGRTFAARPKSTSQTSPR